jgi:hypothetical protein
MLCSKTRFCGVRHRVAGFLSILGKARRLTTSREAKVGGTDRGQSLVDMFI